MKKDITRLFCLVDDFLKALEKVFDILGIKWRKSMIEMLFYTVS